MIKPPTKDMTPSVWSAGNKIVGAIISNKAPKIIKKNPPPFLALLCSLCAKI